MPTATVQDAPRYERKFLLNPLQAVSLIHLIKLHPAGFTELYEPRRVNNIYFDTYDYSHYRENIAGISPRKKVRIRWYGEFDTIDKPVLEIKSKDGEIVTKIGHKLPFTSMEEAMKLLQKTANSYRPVLKNSYLRKYFISADRTVRLTVDEQVLFDDMSQLLADAPGKPLAATIIELKYAVDEEHRASEISARLPFRLTKSSKYEQGVSMCYPHLVVV